jgi:SRSO17 transposase
VAAAGDSVDAAGWLAEFDIGFAAIAGRFGRVEPRRQARAFLLGVLSDVDTRSCWQLAEQAGDTSPHAMQRLLGDAVWDADQVRDDVRGYAVDALGDPAGVLILDDTGDLKKGDLTVGTQRQYTGTAGRIENAQVAVYLGYATPAGSTLIDRAVYLPTSWTDDPARCAAAGVPDDVEFATKITLGRRMLARALDAGVPAAWCTADEFYGGDRHLRRDLQTRGIGYVLAVAKNHRVTARPADGPVRADRLAESLPSRAWNRISAGPGSKGERYYDWAWITINPPAREAPGCHSLLIRRRISDGELAFYRCFTPRPVPLHTLVRIAGTRWNVETCFQTGKRIGLDEPQVRRWDSWYRHVTLVMLAHAILTVIAARERIRHSTNTDPTLIR